MTLRHLNVFVMVCEYGSITKAAESLKIAQPAVSQTIKELENYYSVNLFNRINQRLVLTDDGRELFIKAKDVLERFNDFENIANDVTLHPSLKIGYSLTTANSLMPDVMKYINENHPNLKLYTEVNNASDIENHLINGELDFGIIEGGLPNPNLIIKDLNIDKLKLVCAKDYKIKNTITIKELSEHPLLLREKGSSSRQCLENICHPKGVLINPVVESISNNTIINLVLQGKGIAAMPEVIINKYIKDNKVKEIKLENEKLYMTSNIIYRHNKFFTKEQQDIIDYCFKAFKR